MWLLSTKSQKAFSTSSNLQTSTKKYYPSTFYNRLKTDRDFFENGTKMKIPSENYSTLPNFLFPGQQYCWSDTASCISETASTTILPNHLRSTDITSATGINGGGGNLGGKSGGNGRPTSNLETASAVALGRKSYNNLRTTHYGLIDWPSPKAVLATSNEKREFFLK